MSNFSSEIEAVFVHYGTPRLTRASVWALRTAYPDLPITVLDNGGPRDPEISLDALAESVPFHLVAAPTNLHHGPGMDYLLRRASCPFVLLMDTDAFTFRAGAVEALRAALADDAYMAGSVVHVDRDGFNVKAGAPGAFAYVHPHCALVRRATYLTLPPFQKHGAPCLANERAAAEQGHALVDVPVSDYVWHAGRGTVTRYGYGLGWRARFTSLRRRMGG